MKIQEVLALLQKMARKINRGGNCSHHSINHRLQIIKEEPDCTPLTLLKRDIYKKMMTTKTLKYHHLSTWYFKTVQWIITHCSQKKINFNFKVHSPPFKATVQLRAPMKNMKDVSFLTALRNSSNVSLTDITLVTARYFNFLIIKQASNILTSDRLWAPKRHSRSWTKKWLQ